MSLHRVRADGFLFDLDGVLADSREEVEDHWRQFADWYDIDAEELLEQTHGVRDFETISRELSGRTQKEIDEAIERFRDLEVNDTARTVEVPGASVLLKALPADRVCLVTSCTERLARARLGAVGIELPANTVFSEDVEHGKPDPEPYRTGATRLGLDASRCVVFEDSKSGLTAGAKSRATPIAVATTEKVETLSDHMGEGALIVADLGRISVDMIDGDVVLIVDTVD